jgi:hypothetical protein
MAGYPRREGPPIPYGGIEARRAGADNAGISGGETPMLRVAIAGTFAASLEGPIRRHLAAPCDMRRRFCDALSQRTIAGAALDVWYRYPREAGPTAPATRPLHELPNILMTPHVSSWTGGTLDALAKAIAENIRRVGAGETLLNLVA